jgi:hypothetical protein
VDQSLALERIDMRLEAGRQRLECLEFVGRREVVGPVVKADEQAGSRLVDGELRAGAALCDDVSDHRCVGGDECPVGHSTNIVQHYWKCIASFLERE